MHSTELNAQANQVQLRAGLPELAQGTYQTVLANILATPAACWRPCYAPVAAGGHLVLAASWSAKRKSCNRLMRRGWRCLWPTRKTVDFDDRPALNPACGASPQSSADEPDHLLPFCATKFKVVPDQLRISEGWVRWSCKEILTPPPICRSCRCR